MNYTTGFLIALFSYMVGSIPVAYWYALHFHNIDITQHGSMNSGATNCGRVLGHIKHFFVVFFFDALKSFLTVSAVQHIYHDTLLPSLLATTFLLLGNGHSIFLHGKGGKGVSTFVGILIALQPSLSFFFVPIWIAVRVISTSSACASVSTISTLPLYYLFCTERPDYLLALFFTCAALWIILRHKKNIIHYLNYQ